MSSIVYNEPYQDVLNRCPDKYFDLAVCDIPYGIDVANMPYLNEHNSKVKQHNGTFRTPKKRKYKLKDWDKEPPGQEYFDELKRVSHHQIIFGIDYVNWEGVGQGRIKWDKCVPDNVTFSRYENAYCSITDHEIVIPLLWSGMHQAKSLSEPTTQQGDKRLNEKRLHPCHKPILLYDAIYLRFGKPNMKVLDTHLGAGSNRISADKMGYEFVAAEIDIEYYTIQMHRYNSYKSQLLLDFKYD